jgi:hypothetical protein
MAAGFVHGVLNTDNMVITGESFDYGPYRFLPRNDPASPPPISTRTGLYSFGRQPETVFWNLQQLAGCLALVTDQAGLIAALNGFSDLYRDTLRAAMLARLGLKSRSPEDGRRALVQAAFTALAIGGRRTARGCAGSRSSSTGSAARRRRPAPWPARAPGSTGARPSSTSAASSRASRPIAPSGWTIPVFARPEPEEMLIDEVEAIWAPIAEDDDWSAAIRQAGPARGRPCRLCVRRLTYG